MSERTPLEELVQRCYRLGMPEIAELISAEIRLREQSRLAEMDAAGNVVTVHGKSAAQSLADQPCVAAPPDAQGVPEEPQTFYIAQHSHTRQDVITIDLREYTRLRTYAESLRALLAERENELQAALSRAEQAEKDAGRLLYIVRDDIAVDEIGEIDLHEEAGINASVFGREEPNDDDYIASIRTAIDAALESGKEGGG